MTAAKRILPGFIAIFLLSPFLALAQTPAKFTGNGTPPPKANFTTLQNVLDASCTVFSWMFYFLVVLAVIFIVIAAYKYLTAAGNPEKVKGATSTLLYAAIAVGVALLARAIPVVVGDFLTGSGNGIGACG